MESVSLEVKCVFLREISLIAFGGIEFNCAEHSFGLAEQSDGP